jgi:hypothetical protein
MMATRQGPRFSTLTYDMAFEADRVMRARAADIIMARGIIAPAIGRIDLRTPCRARHQKASCRGRRPEIVIAVADAAGRRLNDGFNGSFAVLERDELAAAIGVVDETAASHRSAIVKVLLQRMQDKADMRGA